MGAGGVRWADIDREIHALCASLAPSREHLEHQERLLADIRQCLEDGGVHCEVRCFGSSASGLGTRESDVDLSVLPLEDGAAGPTAAAAAAAVAAAAAAGGEDDGGDQDDDDDDDDDDGDDDRDDGEDKEEGKGDGEGEREGDDDGDDDGGGDGGGGLKLTAEEEARAVAASVKVKAVDAPQLCKRMAKLCRKGLWDPAQRRWARPFGKVKPIHKARIPVLKLEHQQLSPGGLRAFGKRLACDVVVGNDVAVHNTRLLRAYITVDPRLRPLVIAIKHWAEGRRIKGADQGWYSSYTLTMLAIFFLQRKHGLPVLQSPLLLRRCAWYAEAGGRSVVHNKQVLDVSFCDDEAVLEELAADVRERAAAATAQEGEGEGEGEGKGKGRGNPGSSSSSSSISRLLYDFFVYYADEFDWRTQAVAPGMVTREDDVAELVRAGFRRPSPAPTRRGLSGTWGSKGDGPGWRTVIRDPFETTRDLGGNIWTEPNMKKVRAEMGRAADVIARGDGDAGNVRLGGGGGGGRSGGAGGLARPAWQSAIAAPGSAAAYPRPLRLNIS